MMHDDNNDNRGSQFSAFESTHTIKVQEKRQNINLLIGTFSGCQGG